MSSDIGSKYVPDFIGGVNSLIASQHLFANFSPTQSSWFPSDRLWIFRETDFTSCRLDQDNQGISSFWLQWSMQVGYVT